MRCTMIALLLTLAFPTFMLVGRADDDDIEAGRYADALEYGAKYALTEMRPTANFRDASIEVKDKKPRIRRSTEEEGGLIKARMVVIWVTAFTQKDRTTVIDIWITPKADGIYLTRYKLYSDDHNIPITNPQDKKVDVKTVTKTKTRSSAGRSDDF